MAPAHLPGISILVLILGVELLGLWLLPRMGVVDIGPNLIIALAVGGAVGALLLWRRRLGR
jgi:uncharacterized membrane protein (Fun14 family)